MRYFNKLMVFFLFVLFNYGADTFTYTYKIHNGTDGDVHVRLYYAFGQLTNKSHLIKPGKMDKLKFGGGEAGLCLTKIMVKQKRLNGSWGRAKKAKIGSIGKNEFIKALEAIGITGSVPVAIIIFQAITHHDLIALAMKCPKCIAAAIVLGGAIFGTVYLTRLCQSRDFTLIINPKSAEVEAIYVRE